MASSQARERDAEAEPREVRAEAIVGAGPERELLARLAVDVELVGVFVPTGIATCSDDIRRHDLSCAQLYVLAHHLVGREPGDVLGGRCEPEHFQHSGGNRVGMLSEPGQPALRDEQVRSRRHPFRGRLEPCEDHVRSERANLCDR